MHTRILVLLIKGCQLLRNSICDVTHLKFFLGINSNYKIKLASSLLVFGLWGYSFYVPGGTILTYFIILFFLCHVVC